MLLSIDQNKIDENLRKVANHYVVTPPNLEEPYVLPYNDAPFVNVSGTVNPLTPERERFKDRLISLRKRVIEKGMYPAQNSDDLQRIMDETRGRI